MKETNDIRLVDGVKFYRIKTTTTQKIGKAWFNNSKSRFGKEYKSVQLTIKEA